VLARKELKVLRIRLTRRANRLLKPSRDSRRKSAYREVTRDDIVLTHKLLKRWHRATDDRRSACLRFKRGKTEAFDERWND
jgi:hypothetical protein